MADILPFPTRDKTPPRTVEGAWAEYHRIVSEAIETPALFADWPHACARVRAWDRWQKLFLAEDAG